MARKSLYWSIVQADPHGISRLRVRVTGDGLDVDAFDTQPGPWSTDDDAFGTALKEFAVKHALDQDNICTVVPRHLITTRILDLPTHDIDEAASMIQLSAGEYVPYSEEELILDQCLLDKRPGGEGRVLAVFAHREVVESHIETLREAGIEVDRVLLSTACLASSAIAAGGAPEERYALVHLANGGIEVLVFEENRLCYGRGIASTQDWTTLADDEGEAIEELSVEVRGSLAAYRRESEDGLGAEAVHLCSEQVDVAGACEILFGRTGKECQPADFARKLVTRGGESLVSIPLISLGAALTVQDRAPVTVNLLPPSALRLQQLEGVHRALLRFGALAAVVFAALGAVYWQATYQRQAYIDELQAIVDEIGPSARGIASKQRQLTILRQQVEQQGTVLEVFATIGEAAPTGKVNITRLEFHRDEGIDIWGHAKTVDDTSAFTDNLRKLAKGNLRRFANAARLYDERGLERRKAVSLYQIEIPFTEEDDAAPDSAETE